VFVICLLTEILSTALVLLCECSKDIVAKGGFV